MQAVRDSLERWQLLLESDRLAPSVAGIVAGGPISGSWWGHPAGHAIYEACEALAASGDALRIKLLSGKLTYVHRSLWPALVAVATSGAPWQIDGLGEAAADLLRLVLRDGEVRLDRLSAWPAAQAAPPARELESRLLVYGDDIHTERGAHVKRLQSWQQMRLRNDGLSELPSLVDAARRLEEAVAALNQAFGARLTLPWQGARARRKAGA